MRSPMLVREKGDQAKRVRGTWAAIVSTIMQEGQTQFVASQRIVNRLDTGYATTGACARCTMTAGLRV